MLNLLTRCISDIRRQWLTLTVGLAAGFVLGLAVQSFGAIISFGPLVLALLCLAPCLIPLALMRKVAPKQEQGMNADTRDPMKARETVDQLT